MNALIRLKVALSQIMFPLVRDRIDLVVLGYPKTGNTWFWSRTRNKLWLKGEESGNTQKVKKLLVDCDSDAIIYLVEPSGPACHLGEDTCFHNEMNS